MGTYNLHAGQPLYCTLDSSGPGAHTAGVLFNFRRHGTLLVHSATAAVERPAGPDGKQGAEFFRIQLAFPTGLSDRFPPINCPLEVELGEKVLSNIFPLSAIGLTMFGNETHAVNDFGMLENIPQFVLDECARMEVEIRKTRSGRRLLGDSSPSRPLANSVLQSPTRTRSRVHDQRF